MKIKLFHLQNSRSQRVMWLLEELQLEYEIIQCSLQDNDFGLKQLKELSPSAKFPTIQIISENETFILNETSAIMEYLIYFTKKSNYSLVSNEDYKDFYYWKNFSEATFLPDLVLKQVFHQIITKSPFPLHFFPKVIKYTFDKLFLNPQLEQHIQKIDTHLANHKWFAGNTFTIADILLWFPISAYFSATQPELKYPHIHSYLEQINQLDSFQTALNKGNWSLTIFQKYWKSAW
jgi:glutathione S-transferase